MTVRDHVQSIGANLLRLFLQLWHSSDGAQIAELAVSLPLLTLLFVGTYDFGQAFNLKQKLAGATREGARFAANQTMSDLATISTTCGSSTTGPPNSICAVRDVIDSYLEGAGVNRCGLSSAPGVKGTGWSWTFTASGCSAGDFTVTVNRAFPYIVGGETMEATQVVLNYPYQWHFNRVIRLVVPGANYSAVTNIPTTAVVQNLI